MAKGLTKRQAEVLDCIVDFMRENNYPPTIAEIGAYFGISSTNGVNDHLAALERKGFITRSSKARSIQLTPKAEHSLYHVEADALPLVGRVAAGFPILAQENIEDYVPVAKSLARDQAFCLRVQGDSMIEDGIFDGDIIVVDSKAKPRPGDIVVALVEDDEATVKRFYPHGDQVELRPANAAMQTMLLPGQAVQLQGVVIALQRDYSR